MEHPTLSKALESVTSQLAEEYGGVFSRESIADVVESSHIALEPYRVDVYVPLLVLRFTRERLRAIAVAEGTITKDRPEVLFVCVHNAGRSQMAAALLQHHAQGQVLVRSAGSAPGREINPAVIEVMTEMGIDLTQEFPKPLTDESVRAADVVITMGCGDACPIYPGKQYLDWELDDPAGQGSAAVRDIRDDIDARVQLLLSGLLGASDASASPRAVP